MVLAEEMVEFPCRDGSLSRMLNGAGLYAQVLGERRSLSTSADKQPLRHIFSWPSWIKLYSRDQSKR